MHYLEGNDYDKLRGTEWVSPSDLKGIRCLKDFFYKKSLPSIHKDIFDIGTAVHSAILEPEKFHDEITYIPEKELPDEKYNMDGQKTLTAGNKKVILEFKENNNNKIVLRQNAWNSIVEIKNAVNTYPGARMLLDLRNSYVETSFYARYIWDRNDRFVRHEPCEKEAKKDSDLIMLVRTKADLSHKHKLYSMDFKTTIDASPMGFAREAAKYEYDIQAAMVNDLVGININKKVETFVFLVAEKVPPFLVAMYDVRTQDIYEAQTVYLRRLNLIRQAVRDENYPGFEMFAENRFGLINLNLPEWYKANKNNSKI